MLTLEHAKHLHDIEPSTRDGALSPGFTTILNNCRSEDLLKPEDQRRSEETLRSNVAQGIGFETYLLENAPFFIDNNEIVENAREEITYKERMRDFRYGDTYVQVKTTRKLYGSTVYFSKSTAKSIQGSKKLNSFFIVGYAVPYSDDPGMTLFTYKPAFAADSDFLSTAMRVVNDKYYVDLSRCSKHPDIFQSFCQELDNV